MSLSVYRDRVKLSEWAKRAGVHYQTAWEWARDGKMPVPVVKTPSGSWLVLEPEPEVSGRVVAYCRVSSADQKADLDRQVARVVTGATARGLAVAEIVTKIGSGLNGERRKLHRVLSDSSARVIVVAPATARPRVGGQVAQPCRTSGRRKRETVNRKPKP